MSAHVAILTYERPEVLELCLLKLGLGSQQPKDLDIVVYGNDGKDTGRKVAERYGVGYENIAGTLPSGLPPERAAQMSLGAARSTIVDQFLKSNEGGSKNHLVMLDDDIFVTADTLWAATEDFDNTNKTLHTVCMALHPFRKRLRPPLFKVGDRFFSTFDFTGECAMIWRRDILAIIGNRFGPHAGGHGDEQFAAARKGGMLLTRYHPAYEMQHVGYTPLCPSKVFGHLEKGPGWTRQPLKSYAGERIFFEEDLKVWREQGLEALKVRLKEGNMRKIVAPVVDLFPAARGRVDIEKVRASDGEVVDERHVENLVVDKAKEIMAHLLAGDDPTNYQVSKMTFGTNGDEPVVGDLVVKTPITPVKPIASVEYPNASSVRFIVTLEQDEANGFPIAEAGLGAINGLVARVAFGPLTKDSDFIFIFRWTIFW